MFARLTVAILALLLLGAGPGLAQKAPSRSTPVLITADEVNYDRKRGLVLAKGNVEVSQGARILRSNSLIYNQKTKVVIAYGKVSLSEPTGEVIFADRIKLKDDLRDGVVENFRMLFPDNTRVAANSAVRSSGNRTEMRKVVFSPCRICPQHPDRPPLWALKARRVVHDQKARDIEYYDAWMEIFGVPVLYAPYFRHPDPTVKRRSGFLAPVFGSDSELGLSVQTSYFLVLGPDKDLTLTPRVYSIANPALFAEWRHRLLNGRYDIKGSFTNVRRRDVNGGRTGGRQSRGHVFTTGLFDINELWRFGWDGGWTTDDTYLRRYDVTSRDSIVSTAFAERFKGRNYAAVRGYYFQGLRVEDDARRTPVILPLIDYNLVGKPHGKWGRWSLDLNLLGLSRFEGLNSRRLSLKAGWELPRLITRGGHVFRVGAVLQSDIYWTQNVPDPGLPGSKFSGVTGRAFPQVYAEWRFPLVRELGNVRHTIEPRVAIIAGPNFGNSFRIPNEDSRDLELDDTNIFALNRFNGLDRIERGTRIVYGINNAFYGNRGGRTEIFLGNSYRLTRGHDFPSGSGIDDQLSDLVGRISIEPADYLRILYRFRIGTSDLQAKRHEISASAVLGAVRVSAGYFLFGANENNTEFGNREEITGGIVARIAKNWSINANSRYDLTRKGGLLSWGMGVEFKNECCTIDFQFSRSFTNDRDANADNRFFLRVVFKHLGEVSTSQ
ncbi:MAG: LPS-assembly protein LptD [Alphaproteobacteria bacterium]